MYFILPELGALELLLFSLLQGVGSKAFLGISGGPRSSEDDSRFCSKFSTAFRRASALGYIQPDEKSKTNIAFVYP